MFLVYSLKTADLSYLCTYTCISIYKQFVNFHKCFNHASTGIGLYI